MELRVRIIIESVLNKEKYLDHQYLSLGTQYARTDVLLPEIYCMFSGQHSAGSVANVVERVFENKILQATHNYTYMGMWQLFTAANVLRWPLYSIFPMRGSITF